MYVCALHQSCNASLESSVTVVRCVMLCCMNTFIANNSRLFAIRKAIIQAALVRGSQMFAGAIDDEVCVRRFRILFNLFFVAVYVSLSWIV